MTGLVVVVNVVKTTGLVVVVNVVKVTGLVVVVNVVKVTGWVVVVKVVKMTGLLVVVNEVKVTGLVVVVKEEEMKGKIGKKGNKWKKKGMESGKLQSCCRIFIFRPPNVVCNLRRKFPFVAHPSNFDQNLSFAIYYTKYC